MAKLEQSWKMVTCQLSVVTVCASRVHCLIVRIGMMTLRIFNTVLVKTVIPILGILPSVISNALLRQNNIAFQ